MRHFEKAGKERALDTKETAEKIIFFKEVTGVKAEKAYLNLQETQVSMRFITFT